MLNFNCLSSLSYAKTRISGLASYQFRKLYVMQVCAICIRAIIWEKLSTFVGELRQFFVPFSLQIEYPKTRNNSESVIGFDFWKEI